MYKLIVIGKDEIETIELFHLKSCVTLMDLYEAREQERRNAGLKYLRFMYITNNDGKILAEWISK